MSYWWAQSNSAGLYACDQFVWRSTGWVTVWTAPWRGYETGSGRAMEFYVDHVVDAFERYFCVGGLALSGFMSERIALGLLIAYLMLSIEVYLATYALGTFHLSFWMFGPTELLLVQVAGNIALLVNRDAGVTGTNWRLFDIGGIAGIVGMSLMLILSAAKHTRALYDAERLG